MDDEYYELPDVLFEELQQIEAERGDRRGEKREKGCDDCYEPIGADKESRLLKVLQRLHGAKLAALCFSGGGIRSATFNLGILQGLAKNGVLKDMDYLSTVSGGGYVGSWLSSWISREDGTAAARFEKVITILAQETAQARCNEPYQIRFLRDYSNYLTPRVGIFSIDTWTIIGTYLRNLLLNWLILIPILFSCLLGPRIVVGLISGAAAYATPAWLLLGAFSGLLPIAYAVSDLPSIGNQKRDKRWFITGFLVPLLVMACALSTYWKGVYRPGSADLPGVGAFLLFGMGVNVVGWLVGILWLWSRGVFPRVVPILACAAATGLIAGGLGWSAATKLLPPLLDSLWYPDLLYATVSVPVILAVYLLTGALMVAFLSRDTGEQDREWWGRAAGIVILVGLAWLVGMAVVIYGPWLILPNAQAFWKTAYAAIGTGAGVATAILGKDSSTPALRPGVSMSKGRTTLLAAAAAFFLLFLAQSLSLLATSIFWHARAWGLYLCPSETRLACTTHPDLIAVANGLHFSSHLYVLCGTPMACVAFIALAAAALGVFMAWMVNINKFSMHAMYRNRLIRCYLGASREKEERRRKCNPFTGFDDGDDRSMTELAKRPYHVVNIAWNLVKGKRLAWQQRKAASFIMTPLFAGGDLNPMFAGKVVPGGYRRITEYGAGKHVKTPETAPGAAASGNEGKDVKKTQYMTIGTAMAISGAAASPNMGYHSSPLVTFVMAFFNVRLGWWLGNPGTGMGDAWRMPSPGLAVLPLFKETLGLTQEESPDIYLSDGGHFENLGVYEMVRRRCRYIIAGDAGCDCDSTFEDLGNAVRKVRADFGIEIDINFAAVRAKKSHFAVGTINYSSCDDGAEDGFLLYIKPVLTGDEQVDQFNYARMHAEFPHESTADQWFDEAQFESYRKLGVHSIAELTKGRTLSVPDFFAKAQRMHKRAVKKLEEA